MSEAIVKKAKTEEKKRSCSENLPGSADVATLEELRDQVFSNDVVWRNLRQFFSLSDLKDCRLVSRTFNRKVVDSTDFKSRSIVKLCRKDLCTEEFGKTAEEWKNLSIPIHDFMLHDDRELSNLTAVSLLSKVEFLDLRHERPYELPSCVSRFLEVPAKLQSLSIDLQLLGLRGAESFLRACESALHNIRELMLCSKGGLPNLLSLERRLPTLASFATNLSVLKIQKNGMSYWAGVLTLPIVNLLERNRHQVQILELGCNHSGDIESQLINNGVVFPVLKKLRIQSSRVIPERLGEFLKAHPFLQDLHLMFIAKFPASLTLTSLLTEVRNKGERLKQLRISTTNGFANAEAVAALLSVACLKLQVFEVRVDSPHVRNAVPVPLKSLLGNLSSTIRRVSFHSYRFQKGNTPITSSHFTNIDPLKLTVLCLSGENSGVTDETAEFICRNLKMLQKLDLSSSECTDYGFTGMQPGSTAPLEFSLSNLKGLKSLRLDECNNITDHTLTIGVKFTGLTYLHVEGGYEFTAYTCLQVLKQNRNLESFKISVNEYEQENVPTFEELHAIAPRLKRCDVRIVSTTDDSYSGNASSLSSEDAEDEDSLDGEEQEDEDDWHSEEEDDEEQDDDAANLDGGNVGNAMAAGELEEEDEDDDDAAGGN